MKVTHIGRHASGKFFVWTDTGHEGWVWGDTHEQWWPWWPHSEGREVPDDIDLDAIKVGQMFAIDDAPRKAKVEPIKGPWIVVKSNGWHFYCVDEEEARGYTEGHPDWGLIYLDRENPRVVPL